VALSQADFAMSKIAANEEFGGNELRKAIDYFCHMATSPAFYDLVSENDKSFSATDYFKAMSWLKNDNDDFYDPSYSDMLRVAFTSNFGRGKLADLVGLLSGRNFETRSFDREIEERSYQMLRAGILEFMNKTNFERFLMIIKSTGFIDKSMIRSQNALNFAYILYLKLKRDLGNNPNIERWVRRWFVMSLLTGRYSGSPESRFDKDIRMISEQPFEDVLTGVESAELSDAFWDVRLVQNLTTSSSTNNAFKTYLACQVKAENRGFLSKEITVRDMLSAHGDIHHVFPRGFLKAKGLKQQQYNQVANYVYLQQEVNIKVGDNPPADYLKACFEQCNTGDLVYGAIDTATDLQKNLEENSLPSTLESYAYEGYEAFLAERRVKMARRIKGYYWSL